MIKKHMYSRINCHLRKGLTTFFLAGLCILLSSTNTVQASEFSQKPQFLAIHLSTSSSCLQSTKNTININQKSIIKHHQMVATVVSAAVLLQLDWPIILLFPKPISFKQCLGLLRTPIHLIYHHTSDLLILPADLSHSPASILIRLCAPIAKHNESFKWMYSGFTVLTNIDFPITIDFLVSGPSIFAYGCL